MKKSDKEIPKFKDVSYQSLAKMFLARQIALERGYLDTSQR